MGKRQHQKDKMYLTYTEWRDLYGGKKATTEKDAFRRLPFDHCCVSLMPYKEPYCDPHGNIFDLQPIMLYLKKYKVNPVTGTKLLFTDLIKLNIAKDNEGKYKCPVLHKTLTDNSHIVVIKPTGNVFLYEAVHELNIKLKSFRDLLNDYPFKKSDIITLQEPGKLEKFNISTFHHVKEEHSVDDEEKIDEAAKEVPPEEANLKNINNEARATLDALRKEYKDRTANAPKEDKVTADGINAAHYSTGEVAAGFTSTIMPPLTVHEAAIRDEDEVRYDLVKKKGYVRLVTNYGNLNLELHCDMVPKICENFIKLCQKGYYNGSVFHRSIRHFMLQGGDPTGTGTGGESFWGKPLKDQILPKLKHSGRGILSMANSGPDTNKSQFFITYRSCGHLDGKHTIFGQLVGGLDTLGKIEKIGVDNKDRPVLDVILVKADVFSDPFTEADDKLAEMRAEEERKKMEAVAKPVNTENQYTKVFKKGVGKYLNLKPDEKEEGSDQIKKKVKVENKDGSEYNFGSFTGW